MGDKVSGYGSEVLDLGSLVRGSNQRDRKLHRIARGCINWFPRDKIAFSDEQSKRIFQLDPTLINKELSWTGQAASMFLGIIASGARPRSAPLYLLQRPQVDCRHSSPPDVPEKLQEKMEEKEQNPDGDTNKRTWFPARPPELEAILSKQDLTVERGLTGDWAFQESPVVERKI